MVRNMVDFKIGIGYKVGMEGKGKMEMEMMNVKMVEIVENGGMGVCLYRVWNEVMNWDDEVLEDMFVMVEEVGGYRDWETLLVS